MPYSHLLTLEIQTDGQIYVCCAMLREYQFDPADYTQDFYLDTDL